MTSSSSFAARLRPHPPTPPEQSTSKAGRNLWQAVPTALILLGIVAASVLWRIELFVALVCVALCIAVWEAAGAFLAKNIRILYVLLTCVTLAMLVGAWLIGVNASLLIFVIIAFLLYLRFFVARAGHARRVSSLASILVLGWIGLLGSFAVGLATLDKGPWLVALLILLPAANDTGGWLAGVLFGKHPMAPRISPKKSWEGLAGSVIVTILIALGVVTLLLGEPWWVAALYGVCAVIASTGGDLFESLIKRRLGIKDMGTLFPGHGGVLDRIDSILMWAPVCYFLSLFFIH